MADHERNHFFALTYRWEMRFWTNDSLSIVELYTLKNQLISEYGMEEVIAVQTMAQDFARTELVKLTKGGHYDYHDMHQVLRSSQRNTKRKAKHGVRSLRQVSAQ